ncbi:TPA: hypothetical protein ACG0ZJ_005366, partial [Escherichia coli]
EHKTLSISWSHYPLYQYFGQHGDKVVQPLVQKLDKQQVHSQRTR